MANVDAVVSRGMTSVTVPVLATGGSLAIARDVGKPTASLPAVGREDPRSNDYRSAADRWTVIGLLFGASAYADAKTLAEDLIKPRATTGTPLQLDLSDLPSHGTYDVAPTSGSALTLAYLPGRTDMVGVQLSLDTVGTTIGGTQTVSANGTPDAGSGVKIEDPDANSVTLTSGLTVTRTVGRPDGKLQPRNAELPTYIDQDAPASDEFEIAANRVTESDGVTLAENIVRDRLGQSDLTLHFQSNLFSLDAYDVFPPSSQATRYTFQTGSTGYVNVPTLKLRVVDNS